MISHTNVADLNQTSTLDGFPTFRNVFYSFLLYVFILFFYLFFIFLIYNYFLTNYFLTVKFLIYISLVIFDESLLYIFSKKKYKKKRLAKTEVPSSGL